MRLKGKVAVITGAGSGIGRATAVLFAQEGAKIVVADIDEKGGTETVGIIQQGGGDALFVQVDVSKSADTKRMVQQTVEHYGRLDILFNNAGINPSGTVADTPEEVWDKVININLKGVFLGSKYAVPVMAKQGGGVIINTASVNGFVATPNEVAYDASKGGVVMLTKAMAIDHAQQNIRVNCVCPGVVATPLIKRYIAEAPDPAKMRTFFEEYNAAIRRMIEPKEVASTVLFLASEDASAVTGAAYLVDGGLTAV